MRAAILIIVTACTNAPAAPAGTATVETTVPVTTSAVMRTDVPVIVRGPGRTDSLEKLQIRAPFDGVLRDLTVTDGDHVKHGQVVGWVVSRDSQAALVGSQAMLAAAQTQQQRRDAERALALAKRNMVRTQLRAPEDGIVISHQVDEGARLALNEQIVVIVAADSIVFLAQIAQNDLAQVRPGNPVQVDLAAQPKAPMIGTVRSILPGGSATDLTAPVRVDFEERPPRQLNLYGVARVTVGTHVGALVVPATAVIRDDIAGTSRVALVDATGHAHWIGVTPGIVHGDRVELVSPPFGEGARVVVTGQVGLPEGSRVQETHAGS